jgi:hypothetical protein
MINMDNILHIIPFLLGFSSTIFQKIDLFSIIRCKGGGSRGRVSRIFVMFIASSKLLIFSDTVLM